MTRRARVASWLVVLVTIVFLFAPVVLVVLFSFNGGTSTSPPLDGLSFRWYEVVFSEEKWTAAFKNTALVALYTVFITTVLGTVAAVGIMHLRPRWRAAMNGLVATPLILPVLFTGVALLVFFDRLEVTLSVQTIVVGHVLVTLPLVTFIVAARLSRLDPAVMEASRDLGAGAFQAFRKVLLPQIAPALIGAALLTVATSVDELIIALFTNGGDQTVPVVIFSSFRQGVGPEINAIASVMLGVTVVLTIVAGRLVSPRAMVRG
jgi:spermidine/putrescine transport system permease protein